MQNFGTEINGRKYRAPWTPMLVMSVSEPNALFLGTQYVMKTTDGGLHWEKISPDLTGVGSAATEKSETLTTAENAMERGFGVVYSIAPSPKKTEVIWAGSDTGLIHVTTDGGKSWRDVTPKGVSAWSKIAMIEASRFDPATAYVAVDRHRLDDQAPYVYRTQDYGKTWQPIASGIGPDAFVNAIREDLKQSGLLFAGTERGVYVSFDDGDHWQPLQLNLPVTSVRDFAIHDDDLVIATHGRAFWIMDNITPLRQIAAGVKADKTHLFEPAVAVRVDNDVFLGSPFPPEEPMSTNPSAGAVIDYYLPANAQKVTLEIFDAKATLVRRFMTGEMRPQKIPPLPIAAQWLPKPVVLESGAGMHRFLWDLRWSSSGTGEELEDEGFGAPRGPKIIPGTYQVKLTVDGATFEAPLEVQMDPRSKATAAELEQQQNLGLEVFQQVRGGRKALAEMNAVKADLDRLAQQLNSKPELQAESKKIVRAIEAIQKGSKPAPDAMGLEAASSGLQSVLRVVEGGDRTTPQQAIELYGVAQKAAHARIGEWTALKAGGLAEFNHALEKAGLHFVDVSSIEAETGELRAR